jgi:hypothetical protein
MLPHKHCKRSDRVEALLCEAIHQQALQAAEAAERDAQARGSERILCGANK